MTGTERSDALVGRESELAMIASTLSDARTRPTAVVLEGGPGIGKTALWRVCAAQAAENGLRVLACRPVSGETRLSFTALEDLLGDGLSEVSARVPAPQVRGLEIAFLRADAAGTAIDRRTIAAATLSVLRELGSDQPLLLAIDDVQWLDEPSASALAYALRRLGDARVSVLACARREAVDTTPTAVEVALDERGDTLRVVVGPMSSSALHLVIRSKLGISFTHDVLDRVHRASGGNPLHALELARALERRSHPLEAGGALPVPASLREVVRGSIDALSASAQELLTVVAALSDPTVETVDRTGAGAALDEAVHAGVLDVDEAQRLRFTHPLLASTALAGLGPQARRELHRRLALVVDGEERARHLALGAAGPSAEIAGALHDAARAAAARGASGTAAELAASAVRLTPADRPDDLARRELDAAAYETRNGDWRRARERLEPLVDALPPGDLRATALVRLARLEDTTRHLELCRRAIDETQDVALQAEAHQLAAEGSMMAGDLPSAVAYARVAARHAEEIGDRSVLVECLGTLCHYETFTGSITAGALERGVEIERGLPHPSSNYSPQAILGHRLMYGDRLDEARDLLEAAYGSAVELGDEYARVWLLNPLTQLECRAGRLAQADRYAREAAIICEQIGGMAMISCFLTALVGSHVGSTDAARAAAGEGAILASDEGYELYRILNLWVLGRTELSVGDMTAADRQLRSLPGAVDAMGYVNPGARPVYADAIEARLGSGDLSVEPQVDELERRGRALDCPWARATAARCRGLLLAARGESDAAAAELSRALVEHESCPQPLELGRTLLAIGSVERRAKHRGAARNALNRALELFDALGAARWAERAAGELQRLPGRRPGGSNELTETERQIAELVAGGLSNKQVAARLFVAVRTVEANLTKVYAKLEVRSRAELAAKLRA